MGEHTKISWTDHTWNPWWGCQRVSPGCQHCYAEAFAKRTGNAVWGKDAERRFFGDKHWAEPLRWDAAAAAAGYPALVFCASMADVFEDRADLVDHRARLWDLIAATPHLIWQLLTKRPENVRGMVPDRWITHPLDDIDYIIGDWPANVWIGTTVEDQERADERIPHLLAIPAPVRFLSCEPLLGPLDLSPWLHLEWMDALRPPGAPMSFRGEGGWGVEMFTYLAGRRTDIGWIIVGGESGAGYRALDLAHGADVIDQAEAAEVPAFFKQVGGFRPTAGGDLIGGRSIKQFPPAARRPT